MNLKNSLLGVSLLTLINLPAFGGKDITAANKTLTGDPTLVKAGFDSPPQQPMELFTSWLNQVQDIVPEPMGFVLSTTNLNYQPSSRVLVMKSHDDTGIIFATSSKSVKGVEMENNPKVSGNMWWKETLQQISFKGTVRKLPTEESDEIFSKRKRSAQALANVVTQSETMDDENSLKEEVNTLIATERDIARPQAWHAYHLDIDEIEFWQGSPDRFHKRLKYTKENEQWIHERLHP